MNKSNIQIALALCTLLSACGGGSAGSGSSENVRPAADHPPTIAGFPPPKAEVGAQYDFTPVVSDPDPQPLTFAIRNKPSWASFETATGRIHGMPSSADVGTYADVTISVSDGIQGASLPGFSITVNVAQPGTAVLSWTLPEASVDGTPLTDLAGFRIHYGADGAHLSRMIDVSDPAATTITVADLSPGTWYFSITAYDREGVESVLTEVVRKIID